MPSNIQIITLLLLSQSLSPHMFLGSDDEFSTAMSTPRPPSASKQATSQILSECSSSHIVNATPCDSNVMPDLPVVIEMFTGDAHVLLSELTSDQDVQGLQHGSLEQDLQEPPAVHAQMVAKMKQEKAPTAQTEQASEESAFCSGSGEELRLPNSITPPADGSLSSLSVFSLKMEATAGIPHLCKGKGTNEGEMVDCTPPQSIAPESRLTESGKSPGPACDVVKEDKKGQEEMKRLPNEEQKEKGDEVMEKENGSSDSQPCMSVLRPCTTQRLSGPVAEDVEVDPGVEQAGERTGEDGASAPLPLDYTSLQPDSLPLPPCFVQLDRLSPRLTRKQRNLLVCLDCAKVFLCFKSLCKHRRFHSGETPFHCPQCPRKFILRKSMRRHLRRHTGEKPYRCSQCSKAFRLRKGFEKHMRTRHTAF